MRELRSAPARETPPPFVDGYPPGGVAGTA